MNNLNKIRKNDSYIRGLEAQRRKRIVNFETDGVVCESKPEQLQFKEKLK